MNTNINIIDSEIDLELLAKNNKLYYLKKTFTITYTLLLTTATLTFIEAIRTPNPKIRHVLNLETCISFIAGYFYSTFNTQIQNDINKNKINWKEITKTRYIDWVITTPLMLIALCLVLSMNSNTIIHLKIISAIIFLNYCMLYLGYMGEVKQTNKLMWSIIGFIPFSLMYIIIYVNFVMPKYSRANYVLFFLYLIIWSLYGVVYLFEEDTKNICTNILDLMAKCIIGLILWLYYTNIIYW